MAPFKLYWCSTPEHSEDWFIVARSARAARRIHALEEGFDDDFVRSELISQIPPEWQDRKKALRNEKLDRPDGGWPNHELLIACGAKCVCSEFVLAFPDKPKFAGRYFVLGQNVFKYYEPGYVPSYAE